jgi:tight adherence protein C
MEKGHPLQLKAVAAQAGFSTEEMLIVVSLLLLAVIAWPVLGSMMGRSGYGPRMRAIVERRAELKGEITKARRRKKKNNVGTMNMMRNVVAQFKLLQQHQVDTLQKKLIQAGYRSKDAIIVFAFAKLVMPFVGLAIGVFACGIDWGHPFYTDQALGWIILLGSGYLGARMPEIIVTNSKQKRNAAIRKGLPDALDLMMICAEAGLSLTAALERVSRELARVAPELAEEFALASVELGFLPDRATALKNLGERIDIKEVRGFVNVIAQTEKYGTPIAQALRVLSQEFRTERMLRAEQKAARLPALMTVPMIVFILPTLFIIVMAPAIIGVMDNF